nr:uncharacterized protein LOC117279919 [Nicotiana tomentosiformis]
MYNSLLTCMFMQILLLGTRLVANEFVEWILLLRNWFAWRVVLAGCQSHLGGSFGRDSSRWLGLLRIWEQKLVVIRECEGLVTFAKKGVWADYNLARSRFSHFQLISLLLGQFSDDLDEPFSSLISRI